MRPLDALLSYKASTQGPRTPCPPKRTIDDIPPEGMERFEEMAERIIAEDPHTFERVFRPDDNRHLSMAIHRMRYVAAYVYQVAKYLGGPRDVEARKQIDAHLFALLEFNHFLLATGDWAYMKLGANKANRAVTSFATKVLDK